MYPWASKNYLWEVSFEELHLGKPFEESLQRKSLGEDNGERKEEGSAAIIGIGEFIQKLLLIIASRKKIPSG